MQFRSSIVNWCWKEGWITVSLGTTMKNSKIIYTVIIFTEKYIYTYTYIRYKLFFLVLLFKKYFFYFYSLLVKCISFRFYWNYYFPWNQHLRVCDRRKFKSAGSDGGYSATGKSVDVHQRFVSSRRFVSHDQRGHTRARNVVLLFSPSVPR